MKRNITKSFLTQVYDFYSNELETMQDKSIDRNFTTTLEMLREYAIPEDILDKVADAIVEMLYCTFMDAADIVLALAEGCVIDG